MTTMDSLVSYANYHLVRPTLVPLSLRPYVPYLLVLIPLSCGLAISLSGNLDAISKSFSQLQGDENQKKLYWTVAMSMFPIGGTIGAIICIIVPGLISRKVFLILSNILGMAGSGFYYISFFAKSFPCFIICRFLIGMAMGVLMSAGTVTYLNLVKPKQSVFASTLVQPTINLGIVISSVMNLNAIIGTQWFISITPLVVGQVLLFLALFIIPESPEYILRNKGTLTDVVNALVWVRNKKWNIRGELEAINKEVEDSAQIETVTLGQFLTTSFLRRAIAVVCLLNIAQQLSGVNVLVFYCEKFVKDVKIEQTDIGGVVIMIIGFVGSVVFAIVIPRSGNKSMTVGGYLVMSISFIATACFSSLGLNAWISLSMLCLYFFAFQSGPGSLPFVIFKTTFEPKYQAPAQSLLTFMNWISNVTVTLFAVVTLDYLHINLLMFFGVLNAVFAVLFLWLMVETRGKTYSEVISDYAKAV